MSACCNKHPSGFKQSLSNPTMSGGGIDSRLQVLQIYRLLQFVHKNDREQIKKMLDLGLENIINVTEPQEGIGVLHAAVAANNKGDGLFPFAVRLCGAPFISYQLDSCFFSNEVMWPTVESRSFRQSLSLHHF